MSYATPARAVDANTMSHFVTAATVLRLRDEACRAQLPAAARHAMMLLRRFYVITRYCADMPRRCCYMLHDYDATLQLMRHGAAPGACRYVTRRCCAVRRYGAVMR